MAAVRIASPAVIPSVVRSIPFRAMKFSRIVFVYILIIRRVDLP